MRSCSAVVQDQRFPGLNPTVLPVHFMKGYSLFTFLEKDEAWQQRHVQLMRISSPLGMTRIVCIGSRGLKGGGGSNSRSHSCSTVYICSTCKFTCPDGACYACCEHTDHPCAERVREQEQERIRQQRERDRQESIREEERRQERIREEERQQERIREEERRQERIREEERQQEQIRQEERRQAILSKLDHSLASAPITKEDSANLIQRESTINIEDQTIQQQDAYIFVHQGTIAEDWNGATECTNQESDADDDSLPIKSCIKKNSSLSFNDSRNKMNYNTDDESKILNNKSLVQKAAFRSNSISSTSTTDDESDMQVINSLAQEKDIYYIGSDLISSLDNIYGQKHYSSEEKSNEQDDAQNSSEQLIVRTTTDGEKETPSSILEESNNNMPLFDIESACREENSSSDIDIKLQSCQQDANITAMIAPSSTVNLVNQSMAVVHLEIKPDLSLTTSFLKKYSTHLTLAKQADFYQSVGKFIEDKLPQVDQNLQKAIIEYFRHEDLVPYILQHYHPSEWIVQSLLKEVVAYPNEDIISLNKFRIQWSKIIMQYQSDDQIRLLKSLRLKKCLHNLSLLDISDVFGLILCTGFPGYDIVCSKVESWLLDLKNAWLKPQLKSMISFSDVEQRKLSYVLANMDWDMNMMQQFIKSVQDEVALGPVVKLLAAIKTYHASDCLVLTTIMTNPIDLEKGETKRKRKTKQRRNSKQRNKTKQRSKSKQRSKAKQWTRIITYHSLLHKISELSLQIAQAKMKPLHNLLKSSYSAFLLENFVTSYPELINSHTADFVKVLDLLYNYQVTDSIYASVFSLLPQVAASHWVDAIDQAVVYKLFQTTHAYTTDEVIRCISSESSAFTRERLRALYDSVTHSYISPSVLLQSVSDPALNNFKDKPIVDWDKDTIALWAKQVRSATPSSNAISQSELIAGVKRAVELHNGFDVRDTQLLSLLTLLNPTIGMGRLAQINTGEGKSLIIAMLATIHALQGRKVDVVTTSTELSIREVKKQRPFFESLFLTVAENSNIDQKTLAYKSDVLYGTAGDFQADILREEFLGNDIRGGRGFDIVIVDEVDSMLFDNRSHSVRLSEQNPGMDHLELPLGVIWEYIHRIARQFTTQDGQIFFIPEPFERFGKSIELDSGAPWESCAISVEDKRSFITEKVQNYLEELLRDLTDEEKEEYEGFKALNSQVNTLEEEITNATSEAEEKTKTSSRKVLMENLNMLPWTKRHPVLDVPVHLRSFARSQIPHWIKNALNAAYGYKKDAHYTVINHMIVPIHYNETGALQSNMVWCDALTQFLQLKEGLSIDPEGVSTNFISNISFFKRYGSSIYGLTGTLGGKATQDFLHKMYYTDIVIIPPYQRIKIIDNGDSPYLCKELIPIILANEVEWYKRIIDNALIHAQLQRAVLVICKYIRQVKYLAKNMSKRYDSNKITIYTGEDLTFQKSRIDSGEIIIATNIAGRGTDFETSQSVEFHGGMYICITFLPESYRVEMQNVGRTSRAGKKGMAQLIIYDSVRSNMQAIKKFREEQEMLATSKALDDAQKMLVEEHVFKKFCCLESEYLPTASLCEKIQKWENLTAAWHEHAAEELSPAKIAQYVNQKVINRKKELIQASLGSLSETEASMLTAYDRQNFLDKAARLAASEQLYFEAAYKDYVLSHFCNAHSNVPQDLIACLKDGQTFQPNCSDLAIKFAWGYYERKGFEENGGFWRKSKHFEEEDVTIEKATSMFELEFATPVKECALNDQLVCNPYFYVLKGNQCLFSGDLSSAIVCYDRAISMDPDFSVNARYNKAQALLMYNENKGERQNTAYNELKKAKEIIRSVFIPNLSTLNILTTQYEPKLQTSQHVQLKINLLNQQENYIDKACEVIEKAKVNQYHVKLTTCTIEETLNQSDQDHSKAVREAAINGFTHLFQIQGIKPTPWCSIVGLALIATAQCAAGFLIAAYTGGALGIGLIMEGVQDMFAAIRGTLQGNFDWSAWACEKCVSVAISIISSGWKAFKVGCRAVVNTAKDLIGKAAVKATKDGVKLATKTLVSSLTKGATKELLTKAGEWCTNKLFMEDLEKIVSERAESSIMQAVLCNKLVVEALELDNKNGNNYWLNVFIKEGLSLLKEKKEHVCISMLREVSLGVAKSKVSGATQILQISGVAKMLDEVTNYTDQFIRKFNSKVQSHQSDIMSATQKSKPTDSSTVVSPTTIHETLSSDAPPIDLEEDDIEIDNAEEGTTYTTRTELNANEKQQFYREKGPSTPKLITDAFQSKIVHKLTNSIKSNLVNPAMTYGVNSLTNAIHHERDNALIELRNKVRTARDRRHFSNELALDKTRKEKEEQKRKEKMKNEGGKESASKGEKTKNSDKEISPNQNMKPELNESVQRGIDKLNNDVPLDANDLSPLAAYLDAPIYVYDKETGKLVDVVGSELRSKPLFLQHSKDGCGHWEPLDGNIKVEPTGVNSCMLDAIFTQLSPDQQEAIQDASGLKQKMIETLQNHPEAANKAYETRDKLATIAPYELRCGGRFRVPKMPKTSVKTTNKSQNKSSVKNSNTNVFDEKHSKHTFRDAPGHIKDTPENRKLLENVANDPKSRLGPDKHGNVDYGSTRDDGKQVWARTRDGKITNGGINEVPRDYNPETGLSAPKPPKQKK